MLSLVFIYLVLHLLRLHHSGISAQKVETCQGGCPLQVVALQDGENRTATSRACAQLDPANIEWTSQQGHQAPIYCATQWHTQNRSRGVAGPAKGSSRPNNSFVQTVAHGGKTSTINPTSLLHKDRQRITAGHGTHGKTVPRDGPRLLPGDSPGAHQPGAREKDQRRAK